MNPELIALKTQDGLQHFGAFYPAENTGAAARLAVVLVHGMTGSFFDEVCSALPPVLAGAGYPCLAANNRGFGFKGAATELFSGCLPDIQAAMDWMSVRGFGRIALLGHSKGGVKVTYYQVHRRDPRVLALGLISPGADVHSIPTWLATLTGAKDTEYFMEKVRRLVRRGEIGRMFAFPEWPFFVSAGTLWDHHTTSGDDVSTLLPQIHIPRLAMCGSLELDWCTVVADLQKQPQPEITVHVIEGADHVYTHREAELCQTVIDWLNQMHQAGCGSGTAGAKRV